MSQDGQDYDEELAAIEAELAALDEKEDEAARKPIEGIDDVFESYDDLDFDEDDDDESPTFTPDDFADLADSDDEGDLQGLDDEIAALDAQLASFQPGVTTQHREENQPREEEIPQDDFSDFDDFAQSDTNETDRSLQDDDPFSDLDLFEENDDLAPVEDDDLGDDDDLDDDDLASQFDDIDLFGGGVKDDTEKSDEKKDGKKPKSKVKVALVSLCSLALIAGLGFGGYQNKDQIISLVQGESKQATPEEEKKEDVPLQLTNTEQVFWADGVCSLLADWSVNPLTDVPAPRDGEDYNAVQAQKIVPPILRNNAITLRDRADDVRMVTPQAYDRAKKFEQGTLVTDHNVKVGQSPDTSTTTAGAAIAQSLDDYARSLEAMADDLESKASYNFSGQRETLGFFSQAFPGLADQMQQRVEKEMTDDLFENPYTMRAVSNLESCQGALISPEVVEREFSQELERQDTARDFLNFTTCKPIVDDPNRNPGDENVKACKGIIDEVVSVDSSPANKWNINVDMQKQAPPARINGNGDSNL